MMLPHSPVPGGEEELDEYNGNSFPLCNIQNHQFDLIYAESPELPNAQQQDADFSEIYRALTPNEQGSYETLIIIHSRQDPVSTAHNIRGT